MELITDLMVQMNVDPKAVVYCDKEGNFELTENVCDYAFQYYDLDRNSEIDCITAYNITMIGVYQLFYKPNKYYSKVDILYSLCIALYYARLPERITNPSKLWNHYRDWLKQYDDFIERKFNCWNQSMGQQFAKHLKQIFKNDDSEEGI